MHTNSSPEQFIGSTLAACVLTWVLFATQVVSGQAPLIIRDIQPVPFHQVKVLDGFWKNRIETVCRITVPYALDMCEKTGRLSNFEIAAGKKDGAFCTAYPFDDSDVYKIIEGASYALQVRYDTLLDRRLDSLIATIAAAQEPDGYLYTWRSIYEGKPDQRANDASAGRGLRMAGEQRWQLTDQHSHELYNLGHLYEAAVAHHLATGKRTLLDVALRSADLVCNTFGPGKLEKVPGHEEIEIGLVKLYRLTGEQRYLDMAKFFLDRRGYGEAYSQNHLPVRQQREVLGHAVRACYLYSAMADVAMHTNDTALVEALNALWSDVIGGKVYVTGGIGSAASNEGFTSAYDLPNFNAYCETCASIAFAMWNLRMFQLTAEGKYFDVLERTLYNALDAGLSISGDRFFYGNPLESHKNHTRSEWFSCACCPSNLVRFFPALPGYFYAKWGNTVFVNLFGNSEVTVENANSKLQIVPVTIRQSTDYPWDGTVHIEVEPDRPHTFELRVRIPGWAQGDAFPGDLYSFENKRVERVYFSLNGRDVVPEFRNGYAIISRKWKKGDVLEVRFPMEVHSLKANPSVPYDVGRVAFQRGPVVFCFEEKDQEAPLLFHTVLDGSKPVSTRYESNLLGGVQTLSAVGVALQEPHGNAPNRKPVWLKAIPYFAWANRGADNMLVWLPVQEGIVKPKPKPNPIDRAAVTLPAGARGMPHFVADRLAPDSAAQLESTWVRLAGSDTSTLEIQLARPAEISGIRVYWFDDGATVVPPVHVGIEVKTPEGWTPLQVETKTPQRNEKWHAYRFGTLTAQELRLKIAPREGVAVGIHEIELLESKR